MLTRRLADRDRDDVFCGAIVDPVAEYGRTARACFGLCRGALVFWMVGMLGGPTHFREGPCLPDGYLNTNYNKQRAIRLLQPLQPTLGAAKHGLSCFAGKWVWYTLRGGWSGVQTGRQSRHREPEPPR